MAETFKLKHATLTTVAIASQNIYTCPVNTTAIVFTGQIANIDGANSAAVSVTATDTSATTTKYLAYTIPVPADAATTFLTGKLVLEANDYISANANANSHIDMTLSILEIT